MLKSRLESEGIRSGVYDSKLLHLFVVWLWASGRRKDLDGVLLAAIEATIYGILYPAAERVEERRDGEGRDDDRRRVALAHQAPKESFQQHDAAEIADYQRRRQRSINEGASNDDVNVYIASLSRP